MKIALLQEEENSLASISICELDHSPYVNQLIYFRPGSVYTRSVYC